MADGVGMRASDSYNEDQGDSLPALPLHIQSQLAEPFFGRQSQLAAIDDALWSGRTKTVVLVPASAKAIDGVGRTTIAAEYVRRNLSRYAGVAWIGAADERTTEYQLIAEARRYFPIAAKARFEPALRRSVDAFSKAHDGKPWLIVFDDLNDIEHAQRLCPVGQAHCLLTSSRTFWPGGFETVAVDVFPTDVAARLLVRSSNSTDLGAANALALQLGYLPLALKQAGDHCHQAGISLSDYAKLADKWTNDFKSSRANSPAFATTSIAVDRLKTLSSDAEPVLNALATFAPCAISADWLTDKNSDALGLGLSPDRLTETTQLLDTSSLIRLTNGGSEPNLLAMHPLVRSIVLNRSTAQASAKTNAEAVAGLLNRQTARTQRGGAKQQGQLAWLVQHLGAISLGAGADQVDDAVAKSAALLNGFLGGSASGKSSGGGWWRLIVGIIAVILVGAAGTTAYIAANHPDLYQQMLNGVARLLQYS